MLSSTRNRLFLGYEEEPFPGQVKRVDMGWIAGVEVKTSLTSSYVAFLPAIGNPGGDVEVAPGRQTQLFSNRSDAVRATKKYGKQRLREALTENEFKWNPA
jgi:hypothetical protein